MNWWQQDPVADPKEKAGVSGSTESWWEQDARVEDGPAAMETANSPAAQGNRSLSEWMSDTGKRMSQTAHSVTGGLLGLPVNLANSALNPIRNLRDAAEWSRDTAGLPAMDNVLSRALDDILSPIQQPDVVRGMRESIEYDIAESRESMTPQAQALDAGLEQTEGFLDTVGYLAQRPAYALQEIIAQAPQALQMVPGSLPGTLAAQMAGVGSQAEQQVAAEAMQRGMTPEEAAAAGATAFSLTAPVGALGAAVPGGLAVERMLAGQLRQGVARNLAGRAGLAGTAIAGETVTETAQEGLEQLVQNYALGDPLGEGVAKAAAQGAVLGAGMGAPAGLASAAMAQAPDAPPRRDIPPTPGVTENPDGTVTIDGETGSTTIRGGDPDAIRRATTPSPADAMADAGLSEELAGLQPREQPATPPPPGTTREELVTQYESTQSPEERSRIAGQIASLDRRPKVERSSIPLEPDQREAEGEALRMVEEDWEGLVEGYRNLPDTDGGRTINTDSARELFPVYNNSKDARTRHAASVHEASSAIAHENYVRRLGEPTPEGRESVVFFTGGGGGAGKSSGIDRIPELAANRDRSDILFDGTMSSLNSAVRNIEDALASGRAADIVYTLRDIPQAMRWGVASRAAGSGRVVPARIFVNAHIGAARTYLQLRERYADNPNVKLSVIWNDWNGPGDPGRVWIPEDAEIEALANTDPDAMLAQVQQVVREAEADGVITPTIREAINGPEAAAAAPQATREPGADRPGPAGSAGQPAQQAAGQPAEGASGAVQRTAEVPQRRARPEQSEQVRRVVEAHRGAVPGVPIETVDTLGDVPDAAFGGAERSTLDGSVALYGADGTIYLVESEVRSEQDAKESLFHEVTHAGLRQLLGDRDYNRTMRRVWQSAKGSRDPEVRRAVDHVNEQYPDLSDARKGDEVLAYLAEGMDTLTPGAKTVVQHVIDALRAVAQRLGLRMSDAALYDLIRDAHRSVAGGEGTAMARRVGTRNPTAVRATESGTDPEATVGYDSFRADRPSFERNVELVRQYPGIRATRRASPDRVAETFIQHAVDNLLVLHDAMAPELRGRAKEWYVGANRAAQSLAERYGITDVQAAAAIAALSPQKDWYQNLSLAERVIDAHVNQTDRAWDPAMAETMSAIIGKPQYEKLRAAIEGKRLGELTDPVERAAWTRIYDQTHNDSAFPITSPEGDFVGTATTAAGSPSRVAWGSLGEIGKAVSVLQDGSIENVSDTLGRMHKIRSFYNNIVSPNSPAGDVTIDTHAVAAALLRPLSGNTTEVGHNFGTGTSNSSITGNSGTYGLYAEAYRRAAAERGVLPREMQSITWEAVRTLFPAPSRRPNSRAVRDTLDVWSRYQKREIEHGEAAQGAIDAGGGVRPPDWSGSAPAVDEGQWRGAFRPKVSGAGLSGRRSGSASARVRGEPAGRAEPVARRRGIHPDAAVTLNIGLSTAEQRGGGELTRAEVLRAVRATGARVLNDTRQVSDSEPTLVIDLDRALTRAEGDRLSSELDQEAIVQRSVDGEGQMFGPMADEWGPYNPALFVLHDGERAAAPMARRRGFSAKPRQPDAVSVDAYHYSNTPGLQELDPSYAGTAGAGRERRRFGMGRFGQRGGTAARLGFYVREEGAPIPSVEDVVSGAGGSSLYRVQLDNLYDLRTDPRGFAEEAGMNQDMLEEEISDAGFDGFVAGTQPGIETPVAVVFDIPGTIPVEPVDAPMARRRTRADANRDRARNLSSLAAAHTSRARPVGFTQDASEWVGTRAASRLARERLQDSMIALRDVQEDIEAQTGQVLDDAYNAYVIENLMRDKAGDMMRNMERQFIEPMAELLRREGVPLRKFEGYLLARATPEINAKVAAIRPDMQDGGSGLTNAQAQGILDGTEPDPYTGEPITPQELGVMRQAAKLIDGLRKWTLDTRQAQGLMSAEQRKALDEQRFYVPARGFIGEEDQLAFGGRRRGTLTTRGQRIRQRFGRGAGNLPVDIVGNMISDAQHAAWDASIAPMRKAILRLALRYKNPDVWEVEPVDMEWRLGADGKAYMGIKSSAMDANASVLVPHDGKFYRVRINDPHLQRALLDSAGSELNVILRVFAAINRWQAAVFTRFNPLFPVVALTRGGGFGLTYVASNHGAETALQTLIGAPGAAKGLFADNREPGDSSVPDSKKTWADWAREARENGASISVANMGDVKDISRNLVRELQGVHDMWREGARATAVTAAVKRAVGPLTGAIETLNDAFENALRLSAYVALRKQGRTPQQAAVTYKEMMTNFRRRGSMRSELGAIWLFFNPAMQGGKAFFKLAKDPKVLAGLNALGAMQAMSAWMLMGIDDDEDGVTAWDEIEPWKKERSFIIPIGAFTGDYRDNVYIPLEYGFNIFPYAYARAAQSAHDQLTGRERPGQHFVSDMARVTSRSFSPIPFDETGGLFGNVVAIYARLKQNKDDLGRPITAGQNYAPDGTPRASMGTPDTSPAFQAVATGLNRLGGGDDYTPPYILPQLTDVSPQEVEYLLGEALGGIGNLFTQSSRLARNLSAGTYESAMDLMGAIPVARSFVSRSNRARAVSQEFYDQARWLTTEVDRFRDNFARGTYVDDEHAKIAFADMKRELGWIGEGLELDTYAENSQNEKLGRAGDIKRSPDGRPRLKNVDASVLGELEGYEYFYNDGSRNRVGRQEGAMKAVRDYNKAIRDLRTHGLTYAQMREIPGARVPQGVDPDDRVSSDHRLQAIKQLQEYRMETQQRWLRSLNDRRKESR